MPLLMAIYGPGLLWQTPRPATQAGYEHTTECHLTAQCSKCLSLHLLLFDLLF